MIDLHTHSLLSDGELLPAELARRAKVKGYRAIGISDHADHTNIEQIARSILKLSERAVYHEGIAILSGVEITHVPKGLIGDIISFARELGINYVVVHGETLAEPVEEGTNRAAIEGGADILAHPGLIKEEDVVLAKERGVLLEISGRKGHSLANGHVGALAKKLGAKLLFDTDTHSPSDLVTMDQARRVVLGAGLTGEDFLMMQEDAEKFVAKLKIKSEQ
jgi:histidinol phosphatase-like PHP family hydrolase